jgi:hypothetical protein
LGTLALPTVSIADTTVEEPALGATANAQFMVTLTTPPGFTQNTVTVQYKILPGSAVPVTDFTKIPNGTLTFNQGGLTQQQTITVPVVGDSLYDPNETFKAVLSKPSNATIADGEGVCTIHDNFLPLLSINNVGLWEPKPNGKFTIKFDVNLLNPSNTNLLYKSTEDITVNFATRDGTANAGADYLTTSGQLKIPKNQTHGHISVTVLGDSVLEGLETFYVVLSNPLTKSGTVLPFLKQQGNCDITNRQVAARTGAALAGAASRDAAFGQIAGPAAMAAYFDPLEQEKTDQSIQAAGLTLAAM